MAENKNSIIVISGNPSLGETVQQATATLPGAEVHIEPRPVAELNGKAVAVMSAHDTVFVETDPDDQDAMSALRQMMQERSEGTKYIALTRSDVSLEQARMLKETGLDDVLPFSITEGELRDIVETSVPASAVERTQGAGGPAGHVISVVQARGGIGATTVAVNLACALRGRKGMLKKTQLRRVALVDLDLQFGNAGVYLDLQDSSGLMELARSEEPPDAEFLRTAMQKHETGLDVLTAPTGLVPVDALNHPQVVGLLDSLRRDYDYVVVDMPRMLVGWIEPVLASTAQLLIVTDTTVPSIRHARRLIDFYAADHMIVPIDIVVNHEKKPLMKAQHHKDAAEVLDLPLNHWLPDDARRARNAVDQGKPLTEMAPGCDFSKAVGRLASELTVRMPVRHEISSTQKG